MVCYDFCPLDMKFWDGSQKTYFDHVNANFMAKMLQPNHKGYNC